jgi:hypothetical protein
MPAAQPTAFDQSTHRAADDPESTGTAPIGGVLRPMDAEEEDYQPVYHGMTGGAGLGTVPSLSPDELARALEASIRETKPDNDAIKAAVAQDEVVPGAEVRRGTHLRIA